MRQTVTISISKMLKQALDRVSRQEGLSRSDVVRESLRDYLFQRRYRGLRLKMRARARRLGVHNDEDVFRRIS